MFSAKVTGSHARPGAHSIDSAADEELSEAAGSARNERGRRTITIGGAAGAWGDSSFAFPQLLDSNRCDYIFFDALAEITMGILTRAQRKDPKLGFAVDVIDMIGRDLARVAEQGVRVLTNAGGVNPAAAAALLRTKADEVGASIRIAWVEGDGLMSRLHELGDHDLTEMTDGSPLVAEPLSFNAYLGAGPIVAALRAGADVVITGRCVDSALALAPLIHEFGWGPHDYDALSQGSLAGHLLECGPQATGGLLSDWQEVSSWDEIGYPIAECRADGSFVLTKAEGTGGLVDVRTAADQLIYEIGDPSAYPLPDVVCDWRHVSLKQVGADRVEVTGARGKPAPTRLKACAQVVDGYKVMALTFIGGRDAVQRGQRFGREFVHRAKRLLNRDGFAELRDTDVEVLGAESTYGPHSRATDAREVVVKIALHHDVREALEAVVRELGSFGMIVSGLAAGGRGLPKPTPLIRLRSYLVPRALVRPEVFVDGERVAYVEDRHGDEDEHGYERDSRAGAESTGGGIGGGRTVQLPLMAIAHARSGDKGADANIGVRARHPDFLPILREQLSADAVGKYFAHRIKGPVQRFDLPGIDALNFLLRDALGGGGIASLRFDPQGKAYAQQLLDMPVQVPEEWLTHPSVARIPEVKNRKDAL